MPYPIVAGEQVPATDLNEFARSNQVQIADFGEAIDGSSTPQAVAIIRDHVQGEADTITRGTHTKFGMIGTNPTRRATKIRINRETTSAEINAFVARYSSTTDSVRIVIEGDSGGSPDGSPITNGTSNNVDIEESILRETTFTFSSAFTLAADTDYWIILERTGSLSNAEYYFAATHSSDYANFSGKYYNGSSWVASQPITFILTPTTGGSRSVYKLDTSFQGDMSVLAGFVTDSVSSGSTGIVFVEGIVTGFSNLIQHEAYYGQDTAGTIDITEGTVETKVGVAISATELKIERGHMEYLGPRDFVVTGNHDNKYGRAIAPYNARHVQVRFWFTNDGKGTVQIHRKGGTTGWATGGRPGTGNTPASGTVWWTGNIVFGSSSETANDNNASFGGICHFYR